MFSNDLQYALESTIASFNEYLQKKANFISYSDADLKNAFIQRFKKAIAALPENTIAKANFNCDNIHIFQIKNNVLNNVVICKSGRWNEIGDTFVKEINEILSKVDYYVLGKTSLSIFSLEDQFNESINKINNYQITK